MKKKKLLLIGLWGISLLSSLSAQDTTLRLSLKQCIETGLQSGQSVINARFDKEKTFYQKQEALSQGLPHLEGFGTYDNYLKLPVTIIPGDFIGQPGTSVPVSLGTKHNITGGFKATQLLYSQTYFAALKISSIATDLANIGIEKAEDDLIYQVAQLYYLAQVTAGQQAVYHENINRLDRLLEISEMQQNAGLIRKVDYDRVKVDRENLSGELDNLGLLYDQQLELLKYTIGIDRSRKITLTDSIGSDMLQTAQLPDTSESKRPELLLLEKQKELALASQRLASSERYPVLSMYGQYFYQGQRDKFDFFKPGADKWFDVGVVGFNLSVPIFNGFEKKAKISQAKVDFMKASSDYNFTRRYMSMEYENALKKYRLSLLTQKRQSDNIDLAKQVYEKTLMQYRQGTSSLSDLLGSENSLSESRLGLLNASQQLRMAELDMLKASGNLKSIVKP